MYALELVRHMVTDGRPALVVGVDVYSRIVDPTDRSTAALFGDGVGAVVLGSVPDRRGIVATHLASFGDHHHLITVPAGGSRIPATKEPLENGEHFFVMDGRAVKTFVRQNVPPAVHEFLDRHHIDRSTIRHVVPHQANRRLVDDLAGALALENARIHQTATRYGNTGAASIPVTLAEGRCQISPGELVLLAGFGGGMGHRPGPAALVIGAELEDIVAAIASDACPADFTALPIPESYRGTVVLADETTMFDELATTERLREAGFVDVSIRTISEHVYRPVVGYMTEYLETLKSRQTMDKAQNRLHHRVRTEVRAGYSLTCAV